MLREEALRYGKISDATAVKLIENLDFMDNQESSKSIKRFFGVLSLTRSWDFSFFVPYTFGSIFRHGCSVELLGDSARAILIRAFDNLAEIPSFVARNYAAMLIVRTSYSCGLSDLGDRFVRFLRTSNSDPLSLEREMYIARGVAVKDLGEADDMFIYIKDRIDSVGRKFDRAVLLAKLAYHLVNTFGDSESRKLARGYLRESLELRETYAIDNLRYLSSVLPYMFSVDTALAMKLMDSLMFAAIHRSDWVEHYEKFLRNCELIVEKPDVVIRAERWILRVYSESRISDSDYHRLVSVARGAIVYADPFYASSIVRSVDSPIASVSTADINSSVVIIGNIAKLDISLAYELATILIRELMQEGRYSDGIEVCARLQMFFPAKIDEQYRFMIAPYIERLRRREIVDLLPNLSLLRTDKVKELIRTLIKRAERLANPLTQASEIVSIASKIYRGHPHWSRQLLLFAEELIESVEFEEKIDILERIVEVFIRIDEKEGLRRFQNLIHYLADRDPRRATSIIERLIQYLKKGETKTIARQLLQYAVEKRINEVRD